MKAVPRFLFLTAVALLAAIPLKAQDTFSICAVDSSTGQVGSAGATCITSASTSAIIISDVHPGRGVIHTQSYWLAGNQTYGWTLMNLGTLSPQMIVDSLVAHDAQANPTLRQYGIVDLDSGGRSAGFTGVNCMNYKNHIIGPGYAIQGNILLGQQVLDSMEARFLNTPGTLACRLMAALQGAKIQGADTRCNSYGISSFSAFLRVANPLDNVSSLFLDLSVNTYPSGGEPIDSLQSMFDTWGGCSVTALEPVAPRGMLKVYPNPFRESFTLPGGLTGTLEILNLDGSVVLREYVEQSRSSLDASRLEPGVYFLLLKRASGTYFRTRIVKISD